MTEEQRAYGRGVITCPHCFSKFRLEMAQGRFRPDVTLGVVNCPIVRAFTRAIDLLETDAAVIARYLILSGAFPKWGDKLPDEVDIKNPPPPLQNSQVIFLLATRFITETGVAEGFFVWSLANLALQSMKDFRPHSGLQPVIDKLGPFAKMEHLIWDLSEDDEEDEEQELGGEGDE